MNLFLYTAHADDTTFFLKDGKSIIELMNQLNTFLNFSEVKPQRPKCKIAGIGVLNGVQVALCGMNALILIMKLWKHLVFIFHLKKNLEQDKIFCKHIVKIKNISLLARPCTWEIEFVKEQMCTRAYSSNHLLFFKILSNFVHFCPNLKYFALF